MHKPKINSIDDFACCPHCQLDEGYYQKIKCKCDTTDRHNFSGEPINWEMYDHIYETFRSKNYYCLSCHKKITRA